MYQHGLNLLYILRSRRSYKSMQLLAAFVTKRVVEMYCDSANMSYNAIDKDI